MIVAQRQPAAGGSRRVVVLGGTGFLGRPICRALANAGHTVIAGRPYPA
ncbi:NAD-dependent epimerase/dehydratase family protein [Micromonospora sp. NPDC049801]